MRVMETEAIRHRALACVLCLVAAFGSVLTLPGRAPALSATTTRVSVSSSEAQVNQASYGFVGGSVSADGRFVVFESDAPNLVAGDTNGVFDVFIRDRKNGTTRRISLNSAGVEGNGPSYHASISADGRFVVFNSDATNLVANDTNAVQDVFIRDRLTGTTRRISVNAAGVEGNGTSSGGFVSADGRFVVFDSRASNLVGSDTNGAQDVFIRDRSAGTTRRISVTSNEDQANDDSHTPSISADGRFVAFGSNATDLVGSDTNGAQDVFIRDRATGTTRRISVSSAGIEGNGNSADPRISANGQVVAFDSAASNLVPGDSNATLDVFVRLLGRGTTRQVSLSSGEAKGNDFSGYPSISATGRYVAFASDATNLVASDTNGVGDVFVRDRTAGTTRNVSVTAGGSQANGLSYDGTVSADGRFVTFNSQATNLIVSDSNGVEDIFIRGPLS